MDQSQAANLKAAFDRDGFVILRDFVPSAQLHEICRRAEAATGKQTRTAGPFTNVTKGLEKLDDYFGEFLNNGAHVPILEILLGKKRTHVALFFAQFHDQLGSMGAQSTPNRYL